jgi:large subunit ribosomal protein L6
MSRIGKAPIQVPPGVTVSVDGQKVQTKGPKGELELMVRPEIRVVLEESVLSVERTSDAREHRSLHGLTRTLLANMVAGVSEGFTKVLELIGVGYRAEAAQDGNLNLALGFSHPVTVVPAEGVEFSVEQATMPGRTERYFIITVSGRDKQKVGQQAAEIRRLLPPEPYKGKGIRYRGEYVRRKAGKAGRIGAGAG